MLKYVVKFLFSSFWRIFEGLYFFKEDGILERDKTKKLYFDPLCFSLVDQVRKCF